MPHDVTLVRRSESQAVITGLKEGEVVAHVQSRASEAAGAAAERHASFGAMKALRK